MCFFIKATWRKYFSHIFSFDCVAKTVFFGHRKSGCLQEDLNGQCHKNYAFYHEKLKPCEKEGFFLLSSNFFVCSGLVDSQFFHQIFNIRVSVADP